MVSSSQATRRMVSRRRPGNGRQYGRNISAELRQIWDVPWENKTTAFYSYIFIIFIIFIYMEMYRIGVVMVARTLNRIAPSKIITFHPALIWDRSGRFRTEP